eukprot:UC1_evm1s2194
MPCCGLIAKRYKRMVRNVYPPKGDVAEGVVCDKHALEQLEFLALSQPQLLPKIGIYLQRRVINDAWRRHSREVECGVHIFKTLLQSCHYELRLFVTPLFSTVLALLESARHEYQQLAVSAFLIYAAISEEETAPVQSVHEQALVAMFASMAWQESGGEEAVRVSGLEALKALCDKAATSHSNQLWNPRHMEVILPVILHNLDKNGPSADDSSNRNTDTDTDTRTTAASAATPPLTSGALATATLERLVAGASLGALSAVLRPIFAYLDRFNGWGRPAVRERIFRLILGAVPPQHVHVAVGGLLQHLDAATTDANNTTNTTQNANANPNPTNSAAAGAAASGGGTGAGRGGSSSTKLGVSERTGIVEALSLSVALADSGAIGPSVIEVFHALLHHLRASAEITKREGGGDVAAVQVQQAAEERFQDLVLEVVGGLASYLTGGQKVEIMIFIVGKIPTTKDRARSCLLRCLKHVARGYEVPSLAEALPEALLGPLLSASIAPDAAMRRQAQEALQLLLAAPRASSSSSTITANIKTEIDADSAPTTTDDGAASAAAAAAATVTMGSRDRAWIAKKASRLHWH